MVRRYISVVSIRSLTHPLLPTPHRLVKWWGPARPPRSSMTAALADQVIVPARYNGPTRSGNGGYVSGLLAHELRADHTVAGDRAEVGVAVSLRQPPPLDVPLTVARDDSGAALTFGGAVIA